MSVIAHHGILKPITTWMYRLVKYVLKLCGAFL